MYFSSNEPAEAAAAAREDAPNATTSPCGSHRRLPRGRPAATAPVVVRPAAGAVTRRRPRRRRVAEAEAVGDAAAPPAQQRGAPRPAVLPRAGGRRGARALVAPSAAPPAPPRPSAVSGTSCSERTRPPPEAQVVPQKGSPERRREACRARSSLAPSRRLVPPRGIRRGNRGDAAVLTRPPRSGGADRVASARRAAAVGCCWLRRRVDETRPRAAHRRPRRAAAERERRAIRDFLRAARSVRADCGSRDDRDSDRCFGRSCRCPASGLSSTASARQRPLAAPRAGPPPESATSQREPRRLSCGSLYSGATAGHVVLAAAYQFNSAHGGWSPSSGHGDAQDPERLRGADSGWRGAAARRQRREAAASTCSWGARSPWCSRPRTRVRGPSSSRARRRQAAELPRWRAADLRRCGAHAASGACASANDGIVAAKGVVEATDHKLSVKSCRGTARRRSARSSGRGGEARQGRDAKKEREGWPDRERRGGGRESARRRERGACLERRGYASITGGRVIRRRPRGAATKREARKARRCSAGALSRSKERRAGFDGPPWHRLAVTRR